MTQPATQAARLGCADCGLHAICLPEGVDEGGLARLDRLTRSRSTYQRGDSVYRQGQPFNALYVVRSGAVRVALGDADGSQQVLGFRLPGEILGIDALLDDTHRTDATALERTTVCEVPFARLEDLFQQLPGLQRKMMRELGREVADAQRHVLAMGRQQALERVALFLRGLLERYDRLSRPTDCVRLPMGRSDIACYLGLAVETVSRALGRMEEHGVLSASGRHLRIHRRDLLDALCATDATSDRKRN
ncbi:cyclic nucleotide-binding domain-containing protein [Luteibacter aegosomaticola]|jgi:CRP/FNR family transcriptional regulator, anaerobic regulatory protein|uniref:cyclic nucleotide-binding domain-containing protein n=1 Tax=Luteibacter aegosomaticola TaxID=2911538 RepID=UPI001FF9852D|nr:cyclic nucleotide-binding domain-containing protein [Luteibacter aegosomaticola]UPG92099.1 cyclic nucleotide-binding domain-containing protein [Luteibacter aegosomaticola]